LKFFQQEWQPGSREITPVHIFDKRDAVRLLVNPGRHCSYLGISEDYGLRKFLGVGVYVVGLILVFFRRPYASDPASKNMLLMVCTD